MKKYTIMKSISHVRDVPIGTTAYAYQGYDYGLASNDTRLTGIKHITLTLQADGSTPFFTAPMHSLKEVE